MASRTKQKEEARARRLAEERAAAERARRNRRTRMLAGVLIGAVVVVGVAIAVSTSGSNNNSSHVTAAAHAKSPAAACKAAGATATCSTVQSLLAGIPQSGVTLGSSHAPVTVTEFGDLECPICRDFALAAENQLISKDVRSGKVKLVYRSLETATGGAPDPNIFPTQQAAAYAAGAQGKAWNYIELFYHEQGQEQTGYVNQGYLSGLASQIPGLNFSQWLSDSKNSKYTAQVSADAQVANGLGLNSTPTLTIQGPKGQAQPIVGNTDYGTLESKIKSVS